MRRLVLSLFMLTFTVMSSFAGPKIVMKGGHESEGDLRFPGTGSSAGLAVFKNYIEANSNGEIEVQLYPDNALGNNRAKHSQSRIRWVL